MMSRWATAGRQFNLCLAIDPRGGYLLDLFPRFFRRIGADEERLAMPQAQSAELYYGRCNRVYDGSSLSTIALILKHTMLEGIRIK